MSHAMDFVLPGSTVLLHRAQGLASRTNNHVLMHVVVMVNACTFPLRKIFKQIFAELVTILAIASANVTLITMVVVVKFTEKAGIISCVNLEIVY